jgi:hypothetical protein
VARASRCSSRPSAKLPWEQANELPGPASKGLGVLVLAHRADDSVTKAISRVLWANLAVVDGIGLLAIGPGSAEGFYCLLYCLLDAAYEKRPVAISSNLHPSGSTS